MGKNFDQILNELRNFGDGAVVGVTFVLHQDNQLVGYATGLLYYSTEVVVSGGQQREGQVIVRDRQITIAETLASNPLQYLFSDRRLDIDPPPTFPSFGHTPRQPFSVEAAAKLAMSFGESGSSIKTDPAICHFTFSESDGRGIKTFQVEFAPLGNLLYGTLTDSAVYVISFSEPGKPVNPPG